MPLITTCCTKTRIIRAKPSLCITLFSEKCLEQVHSSILGAELESTRPVLLKMGYSVHGVDQSEKMLAHANRRRETLPPELRARLFFEQGDARTLRLNKAFDAVVLLFHVINYQISNADLQAVFGTVAAHLDPKGIVLFDFWYGPAVLTHPPVPGTKNFEDENWQISRPRIE